MFGKVIRKHCPTCKNDSSYDVSVCFAHEGVEYCGSLLCPDCKTDLAEADRKEIQKAKDEGKDICVIMY